MTPSKTNTPKRLQFPGDERKNPWLPLLLEAYYWGDKGVHEGIKRRLKRGEKLACKKGCSSCCHTHSTIPVYPLEVVGIYWFADQKIHGEIRKKLSEKLLSHTSKGPCPFLIDGACSIHPMRPLACRHFNVFNKPCAEGEDPFFTRRRDVLTPIESYKEKALMKMLPFHGIKDKKIAKDTVRSGILNQQVKNLLEIDWKNLGIRLSFSVKLK